MNDKLLSNMTAQELADATKISLSSATWWMSELSEERKKKLTVDEFLTNRCDECGGVIKRHESADFKLKMSRIRCDKCAEIAEREYGYTPLEAKYVV